MSDNLTASRWAAPSSRTSTPNPVHKPTAHFHNILNAASLTTSNPSPLYDAFVQPPQPLLPIQKRHLARLNALFRYNRLFRRFRHKSHFLIYSHQQAISSATSVSVNGLNWEMGIGEAETMFRVDFFEWYVLLERCLVEALSAVDVVVSARYDPLTSTIVDADRSTVHNGVEGGIIGDGKAFGGYGHRFHANVLSALDQTEGNALHGVLGQGVVRQYLGLAKEFRNRWKDVESSPQEDEDAEALARRLRRYERIMQDLKLEEMLGHILHALEGARTVIEKEVATQAQMLERAGWDINELNVSGTRREGAGPWEASDDAMELG